MHVYFFSRFELTPTRGFDLAGEHVCNVDSFPLLDEFIEPSCRHDLHGNEASVLA